MSDKKTKPEKDPETQAVTGLELLRRPFPANQISKLPKPTKKQTEEVRQDFKKGVRCQACGAWHHPQVVHLDYVGHAALTDRLLDCDPMWNWEPVATNDDGTPRIDGNGGMWIRLTVCGVTRLGYGHPDGKKGGDALKEVIGDALRNAAMRFGAALDLWHKGALHAAADESPDDGEETVEKTDEKAAPRRVTSEREDEMWAPPEDRTPFDDPPEGWPDPKHDADRLLDALKHTADADLAKWKRANKDTLDRLYADHRAEFDRVAKEAKRRADATKQQEDAA